MSNTSKDHKIDFFLIGSDGIFIGLTIEFVKIAWDVDDDTIKAIVRKQTGKGIVKIDSNVKIFEPKPKHRKRIALNFKKAPLDIDIKHADKVVMLDTKNLPLIGEVGLVANIVQMKGNVAWSLGFYYDSSLQVTYC